MPNITEEQYNQLMGTIENLKAEVEILKDNQENHQHLGNDGSKEYQGQTNFIGKSLVLGGGTAQGDKIFVPLQMVDSQIDNALLLSDKSSRAAASGIWVNNKYTVGEQINTLLSALKNLPLEEINTPLNQVDWSKYMDARIRVIGNPQGEAAFSGPSVFGPLLLS